MKSNLQRHQREHQSFKSRVSSTFDVKRSFARASTSIASIDAPTRYSLTRGAVARELQTLVEPSSVDVGESR